LYCFVFIRNKVITGTFWSYHVYLSTCNSEQCIWPTSKLNCETQSGT